MEACADWVWALLDAAGVKQAALAGHSMGSLIALEAAFAPARALHTPRDDRHGLSDEGVRRAAGDGSRHPLKAIDMVNAFSHSGWAAKPSYPGPGRLAARRQPRLMRRMLAGHPAFNLFGTISAPVTAMPTAWKPAAKISCPASLLIGEHDQMTLPKQTAALAEALKARVHRLPAVMH